MPTIEQIRAARALLGWNQNDLAEQADLSQTGIARIENGTNQPNSKTLAKIENAFDNADIEFISDSGVKKRTREVRVLKGQEGFRQLMDDVYKTASSIGGDICLFNGTPSVFLTHLGKEWYAMHSKRMQKLETEFTLKIIVKEGEQLLIANDFAEYRWFPENLFNEKVFYAYGDKLALLSLDGEPHISVIEQKEFSESFRILFNIAWDNIAIIPPRSE